MRVLYAADSAIPSRSANAVQSLRTVSALGALGHEVLFLCSRLLTRPDVVMQAYDLGAHVRIQEPRRLRWPFRSWQFAAAVAFVARSKRWDVLLTRSEKAALIASMFRGRVVLELHAPLRSPMLCRLIARGVGPALITITSSLRDEVKRQTGDSVPITVIHDGAAPIPVAEATKVVRASGPRVTIGYAGHLYPGKGMEIVAELAKRFPQVDVVVAGGEDCDVAYWESQLAPVENITFLGHRPHREIPHFLRGIDIGLLPIQEVVRDGGGEDIGPWTSPLKAFEYMAAGLAVVASDRPNLREIFVDEVDALLCAADDAEAWERAVARLIEDEPLRVRLGAQAREKFEMHYSWARRAERLTEVMVAAVREPGR